MNSSVFSSLNWNDIFCADCVGLIMRCLRNEECARHKTCLPAWVGNSFDNGGSCSLTCWKQSSSIEWSFPRMMAHPVSESSEPQLSTYQFEWSTTSSIQVNTNTPSYVLVIYFIIKETRVHTPFTFQQQTRRSDMYGCKVAIAASLFVEQGTLRWTKFESTNLQSRFAERKG